RLGRPVLLGHRLVGGRRHLGLRAGRAPATASVSAAPGHDHHRDQRHPDRHPPSPHVTLPCRCLVVVTSPGPERFLAPLDPGGCGRPLAGSGRHLEASSGSAPIAEESCPWPSPPPHPVPPAAPPRPCAAWSWPCSSPPAPPGSSTRGYGRASWSWCSATPPRRWRRS